MPDKIVYTSLISQAISDFDAIFDKLVEKGVKYLDGNALTEYTLGSEDHGISDGIATSKYAQYIDQLTRIAGREGDAIDSITYQSSGTLSNVTHTISSGTLTINGKLTAGYYDSSSTISTTLNTTTWSFSGITHSSSSGNYTISETSSAYTITSDGDIPSTVTIDKGTLTASFTSDNLDVSDLGASAYTSIATSSPVNDLGEHAYVVSSADADQTKAHIKFMAAPTISGSLTISNGVSLTKPGYIDAFTTPSDVTISADILIPQINGTVGFTLLEIDRGSITNVPVTATGGVTADSAVVLEDTDANGGYVVTPTVTASASTAGTTTVNPGYIDNVSAISFAETTVTATPKYIKKGSLGTAAENAYDLALTAGTITEKQDGSAYTISVSGDATLSKAVTPGYIASTAATFQADITASDTIEIAKGSLNVALNKPTIAKDNASSAIFLSGAAESGQGYNLILTPNATTTVSNKVTGYIESANMPVDASQAGDNVTYHVAKGDVSVDSITFNATFVDDNAVPGGSAASTPASIFLASAPQSGDYYTVAVSTAAHASAGYVMGTETANASLTKYVPKATFRYNAGDTAEDTYLEVATAGFVDSGVISSIAALTGTPDYAAVEAVVTDSNSIVNNSLASGYYELTITKGTLTAGQAGYISNTNGTVTGSAKIAHGAAVLSQTVSDIALSTTPTWNSGTSKYVFSGSESAVSQVTLTEGYVKAADVSGTNISAEKSITTTVNGSLSLDKAVISIPSTSKVTLEAKSGGTAATVSTGGYTVNVGINSGSVTASTATAGYVSADDTHTLTVTADTTPIHIKAGTQLTSVANTSTDTTANLTGAWDSTNSKYTVSGASYAIPVSGTLTAGYYDDTLLPVSGSATVSAKSFDIAAAAATVNFATHSVEATSSDVVMTTTSGANQVAFTVSGSASLATPTVGTKGYLEAAGQISIPSANNASETYYIAKNTTTSFTVGSEDGDISNNITSETMMVADTYNKNNITVNLSSDAMGSSVARQLDILRQRLAGTYAVE